MKINAYKNLPLIKIPDKTELYPKNKNTSKK